jgi:hypothetical protein
MNPVLNVSPCEPGEPLKVHIFPRDPWYTGPVVRGDWAGLIGSLVKLIEIYFLWRCNARTLCWVSSCSWFYFFTTAAILLHQKLSREYGKDFDNGQLDIVTGQLPTARKRGGEWIALLGAPRNFRHHMLWRIVWIIGSAVCVSSLVVCYVLLGRADITVIYVWVGFQILWLILRSIFFHLAQGTNTIVCPILVEKQFEHVQGNLKNRALDLVFALSKCQMHGHPRGMYAYEEDLRSFEQMKTFLSRTGPNMQPTYPMDLLRRSGSEFEVFLVSVVGDTLLTSAAWFQGSKLTGMDLYDSCIVTLRVGETHFSIPAARALCASPLYLDLANVEGGELSLNSPKGGPNPGPELVQWYYWVPCSDGRWIQAKSEGMKILGKRQVNVLTDTQVTDELKSGHLTVSIASVDSIKDIIGFSETSSKILLGIMT